MPRIAAKYSKSWSEASAAHCSKNRSPMSALGQKRTFSEVCVMSALPPKADIHCGSRNVCFVPKADIRAGFVGGLIRQGPFQPRAFTCDSAWVVSTSLHQLQQRDRGKSHRHGVSNRSPGADQGRPLSSHRRDQHESRQSRQAAQGLPHL